MKVILVEFYGMHNVGDDLFIKVLAERYPEYKFKVIIRRKFSIPFEKYKNVEVLESPELNLIEKITDKLVSKLGFKEWERKNKKIQMWKKFWDLSIKNSDAYLNVGGSIFIESKSFSVQQYLYDYKIKLFRDKPKFIIGSNFGPYSSDEFKDKFKLIFDEFTDVSFRDEYSKSLFDENINVRFNPDVIFSMDLPYVHKSLKTIGISLIDVSQRDMLKKYAVSYDEFLIKLIKSALIKGRDITLFSFCEGEGDLKYANEIMGKLSDNERCNVNIVSYTGDLDSFIVEFQKMETMFATRFHAIVLSLIANVNTYPISYSKKTLDMLDGINYKGEIIDICNLSDVNINYLLEHENHAPELKNVIKESSNHFLKLNQI